MADPPAQPAPTAGELFEKYHLPVFRYFCRMVPADRADDLAAETFLRVIRSLPGYRSMGREASWVFRIASHVLAEHFGRREPPSVSLAAAVDVAEAPPGLLAFGLDEALHLIPSPERDVFVLREVVGLSYAEIAGATGDSVEVVRRRLHKVRLRMRNLLAGWRSSRRRSSRREQGEK
jgi:RNA polymerase sigma-70 factor, ECF subfamily